jgi:hypothetical protein
MTFHEDALRLAKEQQTREQARQEEARKLAEQQAAKEYELLQAKCKKLLFQWFDEIGMLPHPRVRVGPVVWTHSGSWEDDTKNPSVEVTWKYEGYRYRTSCDPRNPQWQGAQIYIGAQWLGASTKEAIGRALLAKDPTPLRIKRR